MDRNNLMRVNGSLQPRTTYAAPVDFGLRTGETIILHPEKGSGPGSVLALLESAVVAPAAADERIVTGTIHVLAAIESDDKLKNISGVPTFFADIEAISPGIGRAYYNTVDETTDPATKERVQPAALLVGELLTDSRVPVALNASGFNRHTVLLAQSGAGKSYALGVVMEELLQKTTARIVIIDPNGDFSRLGELPEASGMIIAESRDPSRYRAITRRLLRSKTRGGVLNLNTVDHALWESIIDEMLGALWERRDALRPTLIVIDEAHHFAPAGNDSAPIANLLMRIAAEGRKYGLWLILASQRPQKLHGNVISQCDNLILMRIGSQTDVDHIAASFGAVDRPMLQLATGFRSGSAVIVGRIVKSPTLMRFRARRLAEAGGDISLRWACLT